MNSTLPSPSHNIPIPPQLEMAVGYTGSARFFAIFWQAAGDEAMVADGRVSHDGCWWGYQAFIDHPAVALGLLGHRYDLGSSDSEATHWLVVDRETRTATITARSEAERLLEAQHPPLPQVKLTREQWAEIVANWNQIARQAMAEAASALGDFDPFEAIERENTVVSEMKAWLDAQLPDGWQERLVCLMTDIANTEGNA